MGVIRIHSHPGATPLAGATQWSETRSPGPTKFPKASTGPVEDHVDHETQTPEAPPEVRIQQIKNRVASRSFSIPCCMQQAPCKVLGILGDPMVVTHILNPMRSEKSVQCNPMSPGTPPPAHSLPLTPAGRRVSSEVTSPSKKTKSSHHLSTWVNRPCAMQPLIFSI